MASKDQYKSRNRGKHQAKSSSNNEIKECVVTEVNYDLARAQISKRHELPDSSLPGQVVNEREYVYILRRTRTLHSNVKATWSFGDQTLTGVNMTLSAGLPSLEKGSVVVSDIRELNGVYGQEHSQTISHEEIADVRLNPGQEATLVMSVEKLVLNVPFRATVMEVHWNKKCVESEKAGMYKAKCVVKSNLRAEISDDECLRV